MFTYVCLYTACPLILACHWTNPSEKYAEGQEFGLCLESFSVGPVMLNAASVNVLNKISNNEELFFSLDKNFLKRKLM